MVTEFKNKLVEYPAHDSALNFFLVSVLVLDFYEDDLPHLLLLTIEWKQHNPLNCLTN